MPPKSYGGFFESSSGMVPAPGICHPALTEHQMTLSLSTAVEFDLEVLTYPYGNEWPALKTLHFQRGWAYGWDTFGNNWVWPVWRDQFGRSAGGEAVLWGTYATT
jgi:hypothetical protein